MATTEYVRANAGIGTDGSALDVGDNVSTINEANDPQMRRRWEKVQEYANRYFDVLSKTGMADTKEARATRDWIRATQRTSRREIQSSIVWREEFFEKQGKEVIEKGMPLYQKFTKLLNEAKPYISKNSEREWLDRLRDNSKAGFQAKQYWVDHQLPGYITRWKKVAKERDTAVKDPKFKEMAEKDPELAVILKRDEFLDLHYNERVGKLAKAKAYLLAMEKGRTQFFSAANQKLQGAAFMHVLADHKIGVWLERIFKKNASPQRMEEFINGNSFNSLSPMIERWTQVKFRFDMLKDKADKLDQDTAARGLNILSETQFLAMHYTQRKRYVEELDSRINGAKDINEEKPIFLEIRFAIDTKDGEDATKLIQKAKLMQLTEKERERLSSLERFANQFIPKEKTETAADPVQVCREIDTVVEEIGVHHGEMKPLTKELLKSPKPNLPFNQVRWMAYNERWTEKHGYLDYDIAKFGASPQNESRTRERAHRGEDVGRHNTIGHTTEGQNYMRKTEVVRHSATFEHLDVSDQTATLQLAEWCKYPRSPKDLYWRTLCCHSKGEPKPSNWHEDWYLRLTKLRSLTRTLEKSNVRYVGEGMDPVPLSGAGLVAPAKSAPTNEATASNAMAL